MPANTAKGYPYPLGTDRVMDGDDAIRALAEKVDTAAGVLASGTVTIPITAVSTNANVAVAFPVGRFTAPPTVVAIPQATAPTNYHPMTVSGITAAGCTIYGARAVGTAPFTAMWIATQQ